MSITMIGLDTAKSVFQVHGVNETGKVEIRRKLRRSELIPFFLRISRYFCGVMYLIITLPAVLKPWEKQVLSLNPFAVFISLIRVAFMSSYRANSAGNQPFNNGLCQQFLGKAMINGATSETGGHILMGTQNVPTWFMNANLFKGGVKPATVNIPLLGNSPLTRISNIPLQASCHAIVTNNDLWIAALCRHHALPLLSHDRHFDLVSGIKRFGW